MAAKLLEVQGLRVAYDKIEAVTGVTWRSARARS